MQRRVWRRSGILATTGAKSNPRMPWRRCVTRPQGIIFYSDWGVHPLVARCEPFVLQAALQVFLDSHVPTRDSHHGVGMVADDSFEKALSTLLESTDVAT